MACCFTYVSAHELCVRPFCNTCFSIAFVFIVYFPNSFDRAHYPPRTSAKGPTTSRLQCSGPDGPNGSTESGAFPRRSHGGLLQFRSWRRRRYVLIASTSGFRCGGWFDHAPLSAKKTDNHSWTSWKPFYLALTLLQRWRGSCCGKCCRAFSHVAVAFFYASRWRCPNLLFVCVCRRWRSSSVSCLAETLQHLTVNSLRPKTSSSIETKEKNTCYKFPPINIPFFFYKRQRYQCTYSLL